MDITDDPVFRQYGLAHIVLEHEFFTLQVDVHGPDLTRRYLNFGLVHLDVTKRQQIRRELRDWSDVRNAIIDPANKHRTDIAFPIPPDDPRSIMEWVRIIGNEIFEIAAQPYRPHISTIYNLARSAMRQFEKEHSPKTRRT